MRWTSWGASGPTMSIGHALKRCINKRHAPKKHLGDLLSWCGPLAAIARLHEMLDVGSYARPEEFPITRSNVFCVPWCPARIPSWEFSTVDQKTLRHHELVNLLTEKRAVCSIQNPIFLNKNARMLLFLARHCFPHVFKTNSQTLIFLLLFLQGFQREYPELLAEWAPLPFCLLSSSGASAPLRSRWALRSSPHLPQASPPTRCPPPTQGWALRCSCAGNFSQYNVVQRTLHPMGCYLSSEKGGLHPQPGLW